MAITRQPTQPTLFLSSELNDAQRRAVQRRVQAGELRRIAPGIVTSMEEDQWAGLLQREKLRVIASIFPQSVISHKSAFNALVGPVVHLTVQGNRREVKLPGLHLIAYPGAGPLEGDQPMNGTNVYFPSQARMFLDNLSRNDGDRNVSKEVVEERALQICDIQGEDKLVALRNQVELIAPMLGREKQAASFGQIVGAILGTRKAKNIASGLVRASADGYDKDRMERLDALINELRKTPLPDVPDVASKGPSLINFAFLESYFSNYIEGTEFEISEAREIVLDGKISEMRPKDAHDIVGVFNQITHPGWRLQTLSASEGVLNQLQARHAHMMEKRPEVRPGEFKLLMNRAGNTAFVQPRLVKGTLVAGAKRLTEVEPGLARAMYAMFLVAEVHPFDDGNGRLARLVMNAELSQESKCRVIIPTLYREIYLDALRALTREGNPTLFVKAIVDIQQWTASFDFEDTDDVIAAMQKCNAFEKSLVSFQLLTPEPATQLGRERER